MRTYYDEISFNTTVLAKKMHLYLTRKMAEYGVTPEQWTILNIIQLRGEMTQKETAKLAHKDAPTVNRIVEVLIRKQLIRRVASRTDRRKTLLSVTEKGEKETTKLRLIVEKACQSMFADFTKEQLTLFQQLLAQIEQNIE